MKLVLFDIDGTLLVGSSPIHRRAFSHAFSVLLGRPIDFEHVNTEGKTDMQTASEMIHRLNLLLRDREAFLQNIYSLMVDYVRKNIESDSNIKVNPGVRELTSTLKARGHKLGLVSGNIEGIAMLKLQRTGLWGYFDTGVFGDMSESRSHLIRMLLDSSDKKLGERLSGKDVFMVGDTPKDIAATRDCGIRSIAVATGAYPYGELKKSKPDHIHRNFKDYESIVMDVEG